MSSHRAFAGRYRLDSLVGEGGSKSVYRAHDLVLGRDVALALFRVNQDHAAAHGEILREARSLARLGDNARIVTVFDAGECEGIPYLVTRLMTGGDLLALLGSTPGRRLPPGRAVAIACDVLEALETAHAERVIHRDVTPTNIWLDKGGHAVLGDFGIAAGGPAGGSTKVLSQAIGKLPYMAPEVLQGRQASPSSDLYSLGCTLYELLAGRPPFVGDTDSIIGQHVAAAPVPPSQHAAGIPPSLDRVVLRLLAKQPALRLGAAAARASLLSVAIDAHQPLSALGPPPPIALLHPTQALTVHRPRRSTRRWLVGSMALLAAILLAGTVLAARGRTGGVEEQTRTQNAAAVPTATPAPAATPTPAAPTPTPSSPAVALQSVQMTQAIRDTIERSHDIWIEAMGRGGTTARLNQVYADSRLADVTAEVMELRAAGQYEVHERVSIEYVSASWTAPDQGRAETLEEWSVTRYDRGGRALQKGTSREQAVYTLRRGATGWRIVSGSTEVVDAPAVWYTVVVESFAVAEGRTRQDAEWAATRLRLRGFTADVLLSSDYPQSFRSGFWVVYSGHFTTREAAVSHLGRIQRGGYPKAAVREVDH